MSPTIALHPTSPTYPSSLTALGTAERPPPTLWMRGRLPALPAVAIVGTRAPSAEAVDFTRALATALVREGVAIWSGGALGIDAAAHEAALEAGGLTVVVAGGGLDRPYPAQHRDLFDRILAQGGALVARVPDGTPPLPAHFIARNEILAALTAVTVVVQAGMKSGARSTAAAARRLGRALCVVPHPPWDERGQGCALELARGALAVCGSGEVLAALGRPPPSPSPRRRKGVAPKVKPPQAVLPLPALQGDPLDPGEANVLAVLDEFPAHHDEVCERAGQAGAAVAGALLTLTLRSVVVEGPAGFFRRAPPFV